MGEKAPLHMMIGIAHVAMGALGVFSLITMLMGAGSGIPFSFVLMTMTGVVAAGLILGGL